jgi:hypothetical protein
MLDVLNQSEVLLYDDDRIDRLPFGTMIIETVETRYFAKVPIGCA